MPVIIEEMVVEVLPEGGFEDGARPVEGATAVLVADQIALSREREARLAID